MPELKWCLVNQGNVFVKLLFKPRLMSSVVVQAEVRLELPLAAQPIVWAVSLEKVRAHLSKEQLEASPKPVNPKKSCSRCGPMASPLMMANFELTTTQPIESFWSASPQGSYPENCCEDRMAVRSCSTWRITRQRTTSSPR